MPIISKFDLGRYLLHSSRRKILLPDLLLRTQQRCKTEILAHEQGKYITGNF